MFQHRKRRRQPFNNEYYDPSLVNFKDKFVFLFSNEFYYRYSLAEEDKLEDLPRITTGDYPSACSLADKVYVLDPESHVIKVLHNPGAPVSSQEMLWQKIRVPKNVPIPDYHPAFAPLNSNEIAIVGGKDKNGTLVRDIETFDTTTCEFKREVANIHLFMCFNN